MRKTAPFHELPGELFDRVVDQVDDFPTAWDEACTARETLTEERVRSRGEFDDTLAEVSASGVVSGEPKLLVLHRRTDFPSTSTKSRSKSAID